ncbi:MAG TPA: hypothetical protein VJ436_03325 [Anaerolineales bacterium]|nr:hypothetical protein [Anaerolineales bacterium]
MDIFFRDPTEVPLPPEEVRIREFRAEPWPDNRRVRVYLEITPFQKRPNGELKLLDPQGEEVASVTIIETLDRKIEITMHLRGAQASGEYTATASVYYAEPEELTAHPDRANPTPVPFPTRLTVIDTAQAKFTIQSPEADP